MFVPSLSLHILVFLATLTASYLSLLRRACLLSNFIFVSSFSKSRFPVDIKRIFPLTSPIISTAFLYHFLLPLCFFQILNIFFLLFISSSPIFLLLTSSTYCISYSTPLLFFPFIYFSSSLLLSYLSCFQFVLFLYFKCSYSVFSIFFFDAGK